MSFPVLFTLLPAVLLIAAFSWFTSVSKDPHPPPAGATEEFINKWLKNENGTFATYIQQGSEEDEDLVKGRESLAETLGLWMVYALEKENQALFDQAYEQLQVFFMESDGFVNWKITPEGTSEVSANALIDDIRIASALLAADKKWSEERYAAAARKVNAYLNTNNVKNGIFSDFYERKDEYAGNSITLSYIDAQALNMLAKEGGLNLGVAENTIHILKKAPLENGFYPKSFNIEKKRYRYDMTINMVDQAITAYHHAKIGNSSPLFLGFIKEEMEEQGLIRGMYNKNTKKPAVAYESPAVYGFLVLYCLEIDERKLASDLYKQMKEHQVSKQNSDFYGGYGVHNNNTHIFDNLIPLLAEEEMMKYKSKP